MRVQAAGLAFISVVLVLAAILVAPDSLHWMWAILSWAALSFYLAAIIQTGSLSQPAYLLSLPLIFAPIAIIQAFVAIAAPILYGVKWALGIKSARQRPAHTLLPQTWADLQASAQLKRHKQQPGFRLLLGLGRRRLVDVQLGETLHHLLITGETGAGKSSVIRTFLCTLLLDGPGLFDRLEVYILDNKGGLGRPFLPIIQAHDQMSVFQDEDSILGCLEFLRGQITVRQAAMDDALVETPEAIGLRRILVIVDDLQDIIGNKDIEAAIASIASKGRSSGVHLVLSMPYSKATILKTTISINFARISGYIRNKHAQDSIGISDLNKLSAFNFALDDDRRLNPVLFRPYQIEPAAVAALASQFAQAYRRSDEILVELFVQHGGLGRRELAKRGLARARVIHGDAVPFPFDEIDSTDSERVRMTAAARDYIVNIVRLMIKFGLAEPAEAGASPTPVTRDIALAIKVWRNKIQQEVGND